MGTKHGFVSCCALLVAACGAGDNKLDPADLELRDVLGIAPETASTWDDAQRDAARHVIDGALHAADAQPAVRTTLLQAPKGSLAPVAPLALLDQRVVSTLASLDRTRARAGDESLALVTISFEHDQLITTPHALATSSMPLGDELTQTLAHDAGHIAGPLDVVPVAHLAAVAAYMPASAHDHAKLIINSTVLSSFDHAGDHAASARGAAGGTGSASAAKYARAPNAPSGNPMPSTTSTPSTTSIGPRLTPNPTPGPTPSDAAATAGVPDPFANRRGVSRAIGNPYSFFGSIGECAAAERERCRQCVGSGSCAAITSSSTGLDECNAFDQNDGRGYYSICIDLSLAIDSVANCAARSVPQCPRDTSAANSLVSLDANAIFLDDGVCAEGLDTCLASIYGSPSGDFPGPGGDAGTSSNPRNPNVDCSDSCSNDPNCDSDIDCELDGPACEDSAEPGGSCSDSNDQSTCSGGDTDVGDGGSCGDSEDGCGADNGNSCDNGDCGGDSGCSGGESGGCDGGGGDCGGGDCSGGGGDCGGGDCNAGKRSRGPGNSLTFAVMWALLPVPFAVRIARRARRRRLAAVTDRENDESLADGGESVGDVGESVADGESAGGEAVAAGGEAGAARREAAPAGAEPIDGAVDEAVAGPEVKS